MPPAGAAGAGAGAGVCARAADTIRNIEETTVANGRCILFLLLVEHPSTARLVVARIWRSQLASALGHAPLAPLSASPSLPRWRSRAFHARLIARLRRGLSPQPSRAANRWPSG